MTADAQAPGIALEQPKGGLLGMDSMAGLTRQPVATVRSTEETRDLRVAGVAPLALLIQPLGSLVLKAQGLISACLGVRAARSVATFTLCSRVRSPSKGGRYVMTGEASLIADLSTLRGGGRVLLGHPKGKAEETQNADYDEMHTSPHGCN
jgi:hypothetical protein